MFWISPVFSTDCSDLVSFASSLNLAIPSNCCAVTGVTCVGQSVTSIIWINMGLRGTFFSSFLPSGLLHLDLSHNQINDYIISFPAGLIFLNLHSNQFTSISAYPSGLLHLDLGYNSNLGLNIPSTPPTVTYADLSHTGYLSGSGISSFSPNRVYIDFSGNLISGTIPSLPAGLKYFDMSANQLSGTLTTLSSNLTFLDVSQNTLTGTLPSQFPKALVHLNLERNLFSSTIPVLPSGLLVGSFSQNLFSGPIPSPLPTKLKYLSLDGNKMIGDVAILPSSLEYLYLGYTFSYEKFSQFSGTVVLNKPIELYINYNYITEVLVNNVTALVRCDLSNNPLLGNPNIAGLAICGKNGLYSAASLPVTLTASKLTNSTNAVILEPYTIGMSTASKSRLISTSNKSVTRPNTELLISITNTISAIDSLDLNSKVTFYESLTDMYSTTNDIETASQSIPTISSQESTPINANIIFMLIGCIGGLFVLLMVLSKYVRKHSYASHSKFGRKNSFGTLNTVQTKGSSGSK